MLLFLQIGMKTMDKKIFLYKSISIVGLFMALLLQIIWAYNTYQLLEKNVEDKLNEAFYSSLNDEIYYRFKKYTPTLPEHLDIAFDNPKELQDKNGVEITIINLMETQFHHTILMPVLDSIYSLALKKANIYCQYKLIKVNPKTHQVLASVRPELNSWSKIKTRLVPIRKDGTMAVQAIAISPYKLIFEQMILLLIGTLLIFLLATYCIVYQIKIILRQKKIAQLREDFSYAMIHDMKTPISSILIGTRVLHSGRLENLPEIKEKHYNVIERETEHLLTLINRLLTISKLENDKIELQKELIPLEPTLNDIFEHFKMKVNKPVNYRLELQAKEVYADMEFFKETIENMIDNAIKYSKSDGVNILLSSSENDVSSCTAIHIKDDGLGISTADQKKIFEKFERASAIRRTPKGGATGFGLGLNYVSQMMKAHGGMVEVNSVKGKYTEFVLFFPKYFDIDKIEA